MNTIKSIIASAFLVLSACAAPAPAPLPRAIEDECASPQDAYPSCAGCHAEAATPDGWYAETRPECLPGDSFGRQAFFVLFAQADSNEIPEHAEAYELAEQCFCLTDPERPWQCRTLADAWPTREDGCADVP